MAKSPKLNEFRKGDAVGPQLRKTPTSLTRSIQKFLDKNPDYIDKLGEIFVKGAVGEIDPETAQILSKVRGIDYFKELMNRLDGPVIKKVDSTIRTDKTVVLHDGPAVDIDVGEKAEEGENQAQAS